MRELRCRRLITEATPIRGPSKVFVGLVVLIGLALPGSLGAQQHPSGDPSVIRSDARLEKVFGEGINTEGPAVAPDGSVFFVDLPVSTTTPKPAGRIWRWDPQTGEARIYRSPSGMAAGIEFDGDGRMVVAHMSFFGGRYISRTDLHTGASEIVAALYQGRPLGGLNDLTIDRAGRIYAGEYDAKAPHEILHQRTSGVYRVDPDGSIHRIIDDAGLPNGIVVSPDQRTLYTGSWRADFSGARAILAWDLSAEGEASFRSVVARFETGPASERQGPDGMAVDAEGNLWVAIYSRRGRTGVAVYSPDGTELSFIPTPEPAKNVAFGRGGDRSLLYITAGRSLYRVLVESEGYQLP